MAGPEGPTVLFVGRLTRQKGVGFLVRAAARVLESCPAARFVVMGEGEDRTRMIEMAAALGIGRRVFFAGGVSSELRDRAYAEASVFVLSSVSEPFGLTPLEALRGGAAPVLTDACGVREVLALGARVSALGRGGPRRPDRRACSPTRPDASRSLNRAEQSSSA